MVDILDELLSNDVFLSAGKQLPVEAIHIEESLLSKAASYVKSLEFKEPIALVSDRQTFAVLGERLEQELREAGVSVFRVMLESDYPQPDAKQLSVVQKSLARAGSCIAIGSGTINDLCKYSSYVMGMPYAIFGTAPSMNGYLSANASLVIDGHRTSKVAALPRAVFMDLDILSAAPVRLIRSGIGDLLCRSTCQVDWLFSHLTLGTEYSPLPFDLLKADEDKLFEESQAMVAGQADAILSLTKLLLYSGIGMWLAGGSYPASQGEHMISHAMEMAYPKETSGHYHGEHIAVTTLTMAAIQQDILASDAPPVYAPKLNEEAMRALFGADVAGECINDWAQKPVSDEDVVGFNTILAKRWPDIRNQLLNVSESLDALQRAMRGAGLATTPGAIGWCSDAYDKMLTFTPYTRGRFTFLDVA